MAGAVRARFPKLVAALGDALFETMLGAYLDREPAAQRSLRDSARMLAEFLAAQPDYPVWYAELARLDRAHVEVLHAPAVSTLTRDELTLDRRLALVPAHALVDLTTTSDELWNALDRGAPCDRPRALDWPRTVLVWRTHGLAVGDRTVDTDEAAALRLAAQGTSVAELTARLRGDNPSARALDLALRWIDAGVLVR